MAQSIKVDNWQTRLQEVVDARADMPFEYGTNDCVLFAADCVEATTRIDFFKDYRGTYNDEASGYAIVNIFGNFESMLDSLAPMVGAVKGTIGLAGRGDIALLEVNGTQAVGIWMGSYALAPFKDKGLVRIPMDYVKEVWRVI